jgi:hypothetical protein
LRRSENFFSRDFGLSDTGSSSTASLLRPTKVLDLVTKIGFVYKDAVPTALSATDCWA